MRSTDIIFIHKEMLHSRPKLYILRILKYPGLEETHKDNGIQLLYACTSNLQATYEMVWRKVWREKELLEHIPVNIKKV